MGQASPQESLETILDRGYVAHWLVCGPFDSDVDGGIVSALRKGAAPLGRNDFMASIGGIARAQPKHLLRVKTTGAPATWQRATTKDPSLDLGPFFPDSSEGVSFASFYARSEIPRTVYMDLQSSLGVRVFFNGFEVRDVAAAPVSSAGLDRFTLDFRRGLNLVVFQVPGAGFGALAEVAGVSVPTLKRAALHSRPLLAGKSGYEIAMKMHPAETFEGIIYVPALRSSGTFSGTANDVRQDLRLTLFNPSQSTSDSVDVLVNFTDGGRPLRATVPPIPPLTQRDTILSVATGSRLPGQSMRVHVELTIGDATARFDTNVTVLPPGEGGTIYIVTGARNLLDRNADESERMEGYLSRLRRQLLLMEQQPSYGFDLGPASLWKPMLGFYPEHRQTLRRAVALSRSSAWPGYAAPDERIVHGELILRNILYGQRASRALLADWNTSMVAWDAPGFAAQTAQIYQNAGIRGVVENSPHRGLPVLYQRMAPDGSTVLTRHKRNSQPVYSSDDLRKIAALQRRELLDSGLRTDILVSVNQSATPEPFWLGETDALANSIPSIHVTGDGARRFIEDVLFDLERLDDNPPVLARNLSSHQLGALAAQPEVKEAHAYTQNRVRVAEIWATFASLIGAKYPDAALNLAWRQLLFNSDPTRLGFAATQHAYVDTLAAHREAADFADEVLNASVAYIAEQADTYTDAPLKDEGYKAILVFNASSASRTDLCEISLILEEAAGLALFDSARNPVPFTADRLKVVNRRLAGAQLRFVAREVPPFGFTTYYVATEGVLPVSDDTPGTVIENEHFRLQVDPNEAGAIVSLIDKRTKRQYASGRWNDVAAFAEDSQRTDAGREFWTTGSVARPDPDLIRIDRTRNEWMQKLTIRAPFHGGHVIREITLLDGVRRLDCETHFEGVDHTPALLALTFGSDLNGLAPVFGTPYGASVARLGPRVGDIRTRGNENPSGTGMQPAYQWVAMSPNDRVEFGPDIAVPFGPTAVIHGRERVFRDAAASVQRALVGRGISADTWPDVLSEPDPVWTDATTFQAFNDDLNHGTAFRIVLGSPEQNSFTKSLFQQLTEDRITAFTEQMIEGAALFLYDRDVPEGHQPVPTLILAGLTTLRTVEAAQRFAESVSSDGIHRFPVESYTPSDQYPHPRQGFAVLYAGARGAAAGHDGSLLLAHAHASQWERDDDLNVIETLDDSTFRYAIVPFDGSWRSADIPLAAQEYSTPLLGVVTDLHLGAYPPRFSFMSVTPDNFVVTALKPADEAIAGMYASSAHPREGIILRGYESHGRPADGRVELFSGVSAAAYANGLGQAVDDIRLAGSPPAFSTRGFGILNLWLHPASRMSKGQVAELGPSVDPYRSTFTRYWRHNSGAAPMGFQPLSIKITGDLNSENASALVTVSNNLSDAPVDGSVVLTPSPNWGISPEDFSYALKPGEYITQKIVVLREGSEANGGIIARARYVDTTYQDVLTASQDSLIEFDAVRKDNEVLVTIKNFDALPAEGFIDLVVPPAYWPELGPRINASVRPRRATVYISPFQEQRYLFHISENAPDFWMVAKLAANGHAAYRSVRPFED